MRHWRVRFLTAALAFVLPAASFPLQALASEELTSTAGGIDHPIAGTLAEAQFQQSFADQLAPLDNQTPSLEALKGLETIADLNGRKDQEADAHQKAAEMILALLTAQNLPSLGPHSPDRERLAQALGENNIKTLKSVAASFSSAARKNAALKKKLAAIQERLAPLFSRKEHDLSAVLADLNRFFERSAKTNGDVLVVWTPLSVQIPARWAPKKGLLKPFQRDRKANDLPAPAAAASPNKMHVARLMALVTSGLTPDLLNQQYRGKSDNPLFGHCYAATETLLHLLGGKANGWHAMVVRHEGGGTHWFLRHVSGLIADVTALQFKTPVPYDQARVNDGMMTRPSWRRAKLLRRIKYISLGKTKMEATEDVRLTLPRAAGVKSEAVRVRFETSDSRMDHYSATMDYLRVAFKDVGREQFGRLMRTYGNWSKTKSRATFEALAQGKPMIDSVPIETFLPPLIQALSGRRMLGATTNCWSTVYEIIRQAFKDTSQYDLFHLSSEAITFVLEHPAFSRIVFKTTLGRLKSSSSAKRPPALRPGDIMLVYSPSGLSLYHAAVFIDDDLYFERPGWNDISPFRLNTFRSLAEFYENDNQVIFRRFGRAALPRLKNLPLRFKEFAQKFGRNWLGKKLPPEKIVENQLDARLIPLKVELSPVPARLWGTERFLIQK